MSAATNREAGAVITDNVQFIGARTGATAGSGAAQGPHQAAANPDDDIRS